MDFGDFLIRATAWTSLGLYAGALTTRMRRGRPALARALWSAALGVFLLHLVCAFHFAHHWSHASVVETTARRSEEAIGFAFGEGVYVNYAFTLLWILDVMWWWLDSRGYSNRRWPIEAGFQFVFAFIWINATVVFGVGPIRWVGLMVATILLVVYAWPRADVGRTDSQAATVREP